MKGLKIIPMFLILIVCSYFGMWFVENNRTEVMIKLGTQEIGPTALGFVILTSILIGMLVSGLLCSVELLALYIQNKRLKKQIPPKRPKEIKADPAMETELGPKTSGRFT